MQRAIPASAVSHFDFGEFLRDHGKLEDAIAEYRTAIRIKPDDAQARYGLGTALNVQGKLEEAVAEFRTEIRIKPDMAGAYYSLGLALRGQGKLDEAIAEFHKARDNAERGSELAQLIERALTATEH